MKDFIGHEFRNNIIEIVTNIDAVQAKSSDEKTH